MEALFFMKKNNGALSFITAVLMAASMTACGNTAEQADNTAASDSTHSVQTTAAEAAGESVGEDTEEASEADTTTGTHRIVDHAGREVDVPDNVTRIVIDQIPILSTYTAYFDGEAPYIVGFCGSFKDTISKTVLKDIAPELMTTADTVYAQSDLNIEEIVKLEPDVILYNAGNTAHQEIFEQAGIPAVGFGTVGNEFAGPADPPVRYAQWLTLLEDVFGEDGRKDDFIAAGDAIIKDVAARIDVIPEDERPSAVILAMYSNGTLSVGGGNFFGSYWLDRLGIRNPAAEDGLMANAQINVEQLFTWDTDIIYVGGPGLCPFSSGDIMNNDVEGLDITSLSAVKNGRVYDTTLGMWNWYTPNPDAPLVYAWMACRAYPEQFADYPLEDTIREYYKTWYGYDVTDADMAEMLSY